MLVKLNEPQGDSIEYNLIEQAIQYLKYPIGNTVEVGVRDGYASKLIIDAWRKYQKIPLTHLGIDPYGNIPYQMSDKSLVKNTNYNSKMKQNMLFYMSYYYPEFNLINLEDTEFFEKFEKGYPIYNMKKILINKYDFVFLDGPHDTSSVLREMLFFIKRSPEQQLIILDDISYFDLNYIENKANQLNYFICNKGVKKVVFSNFIKSNVRL
jgi:hypothetical protein